MSSYAIYRDEELIKLLKENDEAAFSELYLRYHKAVYGYLLAQVKTPQHTQDLLQEVFIKIWEVRSRLDITSSFSAYLFRICRNKAIDFFRKLASDRVLRQELFAAYEELIDRPLTPSMELLRMDNLVEEALEALTVQRRTVFELCRKQGKSYKEAANELGISHNTVKEHMAKALASLRAYIQQQGHLAVIICFLQDFIENV